MEIRVTRSHIDYITVVTQETLIFKYKSWQEFSFFMDFEW